MAAKTLRRLHATVGQMQKNLECSICLDLLRDPVSTKCDHQFCRFCIQSLLAARKKPSAPCPLCKEPVTKRSLTKNERMNEIVSAVRGVANALEDDTGIRCTPPKGPPQLSQSSSQSDGSTSHAPTPTEKINTKQNKKKSTGRNRQNVRRAQSRQTVQQVQVYIDSDQSDGEGQQVQLATTNVNISSSFPVSSRGKPKKNKKQPTRKTHRNNQNDDKPNDDVNNQVASKNAQNSLLDALQSEDLGRKAGSIPTGHSIVPAADKLSPAGIKANLLKILDEGSLGKSKDYTEGSEEPGDQMVPGGSESLPDNTELVADIFGLSPSAENQVREETQPEVCDVDEADEQDIEEVKDAQLESKSATARTNQNVRQPEEEKENLQSVQTTRVPVVKENAQMPLEEDPYEFIASQRTPKKVKSKRGRKGKKPVPAASKSKKLGKKGASQSQVLVTGKKDGIASKSIGKKSCATEIVIIDDDENVKEGQKLDGGKIQSADPNTSNATKNKFQNKEIEPQIDEHQDEQPLFDDDKEGLEEESGNMRVEGLFASQATNDSVDLNEDRGLPLYDYDESSDEEAVANSDKSYKPDGKGLRRKSIQMESSKKRTTRRKKQDNHVAEAVDHDADESSTSACEGGPSLRKKKNVKPYERKSTRQKKQSASDSSSAKENCEEEVEKVEAEVSFIQDHLLECDDVDLYLDGDSQMPHIDKEERQQKLKNVKEKGQKQQQQRQLVEDRKAVEEADQLLDDGGSKAHERKTKSGTVVSNDTDKVSAKGIEVEHKDNENEAIVIEDDERHAHVENKSSPLKINSEAGNTFKKPSTNAVRKHKPPSKPKVDYVAISIPSATNKKKGEMDKSPEGKQKRNHSKSLQDPDEEELTIEDSQRERKERNPGGAQVFFKSYKRGSIRIDRRQDADEEDNEDDDDEITLADVFGNDAEEIDQLRDETSKDIENDDEMPMEVSDAPEHSEDDDDDCGELFTPEDQQDNVAVVIEASDNKKQEEPASSEKRGRKHSKKQDQSLPPIENDVSIDNDAKRTMRNRSGNKNIKSKSESCSTPQRKKVQNISIAKYPDPVTGVEQKGDEDFQDRSVTKGGSTPSKRSQSPVIEVSKSPIAESVEDNNNDITSAKSKDCSRNKTGKNDIKHPAKEISPRKPRSRSRDKKGAERKDKHRRATSVPVNTLLETKNFRNNKLNTSTNDDPVKQSKSREVTDAKQENDVPTKSDWEIALELAREFGTEPKQFRSKPLQRTSDETGSRRSSREKSRKKRALSLENVSATSHKAYDKQSQSEVEDVQEIGDFSTEDSRSPTSSDKVGVDKSIKKDPKKKHSKKSLGSKEKNFQDFDESSTKEQLSEKQSVSQVMDCRKSVAEKKRKPASGKKASQSNEIKTVIPETPLLPHVDINYSPEEDPIVTTRRGKRLSSQRRSSSQTANDVKSLRENGSELIIKEKPTADSKSSNSLESSHQPDSAEVTNFNPNDNDEVEGSGVISRSKKRRKSAKLDDSSEDDSSKVGTKDIQSSARKTSESTKEVDSCESSDDDLKEVPSSRRSERSSARKSKKTKSNKEESYPVMDDSEMVMTGPEKRLEIPENLCTIEKGQKSGRLQRSSNKDAINSTQETDVKSQQEHPEGDTIKRPSRNRKLRSRKGPKTSYVSDTESTDHDNSRSRSRSKSQDQLKKTVISNSRSLRSLGRRRANSRYRSSEGESTDRESSKSRERVVKSQNKRNKPSTPEPVRRSGRNRQGNPQTPEKDVIAKTPQSIKRQSPQQRSQSSSKESTTPDVQNSKSNGADMRSARNSPRLSSASKKTIKTDAGSTSAVNSGALFSEEGMSKEDGEKKTEFGIGKGSDTTVSIELAVSNEEYEQENPEVQKMYSEQQPRDNFQPPVSMEQNVTSRRRRNKLSRKKQHGPSSKTSESSTASCTDTESVRTASDADDSGHAIRSTAKAKTKSPTVALREEQGKKVNQGLLDEKSSDKNRMRNISGSTTASMSSFHGSDSDIFKNSESTQKEDEGDESQALDQVNSESIAANDKGYERTVNTQKSTKSPDDSVIVSKEMNTIPCLGSTDVAASSLESEPLLVPPSKHYRKNFAQEKEHDLEEVESASGQWRKTAKRKSFLLDAGPDSDQQSKKRKSEENRDDDDEARSPGKRRSGRCSSQKDEERSPCKRRSRRQSSQMEQLQSGSEMSANITKAATKKAMEESLRVDQLNVSEDPSQIAESCSLQTKRRSRLSGTKLSSVTNSPRNAHVIPSSGTEEGGIDLTPSPRKKRSQRLSGRPSLAAEYLVTSPRRSPRVRHSSSTRQPSQAKSSASIEDEDCEIANSGSLFGTQHSNQQGGTQKSVSSQTAFKDKISDEHDIGEDEDAIGGSQCMFGSNPNSSSENDVEMMSEGSDDDQEGHEVAKNTHALYSDETSQKQDDAQELSNLQGASRVTVTTIPESATSLNEGTEQSPISGSRNRTKNSNSSRKLLSTGSASTCIPTSENASISPGKLSEEPIKIVRKSSKENSLKQSRNSSLDTKSPQNPSSPHSRRSGRQSSKQTPSLGSGKTSGSKGQKVKPQKLSDIDLSDGDVDGDHDLLFEEEEDEVNVLTPVVGGGDEGKKTAGETKKAEKKGILSGKTSSGHRSQRTSSPIRPTKLGVSPTDEMDVSDNEDELFDDNETINNQEADGRNEGEEYSDDEEALEKVYDKVEDGMNVEENDEKVKQSQYNVERELAGDDICQPEEKDVGNEDKENEEDEDTEIEEDAKESDDDEDDDDLIPPTPPCTNNATVSSLSKSHIGSKSFFSNSSRQSSLNRGTQSNSGSSNSFSYNSNKSFTFKHPSATHSQRITRARNSSQSRLASDKKQDEVSDATLSQRKTTRNTSKSVMPSGKHAVSETTSVPQDKEGVTTNEQCASLEDSQSLSLFQNAPDSVLDLNAVPKDLQNEQSSKSFKFKPNTRKAGLLKNGLDEEDDIEHHEEYTYVEHDRSKMSKVKGQQREEDEDDLMACSFLQPEEENEEPAADEKDDDEEAPIGRGHRRKIKDKSSTSDEKDYDTEASMCSEDSSSTSHHLNLTSASSVMSSQSEIMSTQQQLKATEKLRLMHEKIAAMEAKLGDGSELMLAIDTDEDDTDHDESETELDGLKPLESDVEDAAIDVGNIGNSERIDERKQRSENEKGVSSHRQPQLKDVRKDSSCASGHKTTGGQRRSQRLDYSDEESDSDGEAVGGIAEDGDDEEETRQGHSPQTDQNMDNVVGPSLEVCPRSPSPPPPLTQGTMQKYSNRTPLQETLQNVTKLAEQYKSGSSGSVKSRKRLSDKIKSRQSDSDSSEGGSVESNRSRRKRVSRKLHQKRVSDSDSSGEDVRRESQRRNVKRRLRSESGDEEPTTRKSARSSKTSTPRNSSGSSRKMKSKNDLSQKSMDNSQGGSMNHDRTQVDDKSQPNNARLFKQISSSRTLPSSSLHTIENSVLESSRNDSQTQNTMRERNTSTHPSNVQSAVKSPAVLARNPAAEKRSPVMEMGCRRSLMQEDSAPVVVKNIRKNNGRFSFVATGLSRQELREVEKLAKLTGCKFASMFNANTTHVIINTDEDLVCERTLKYFQGIAGRVWIVSYSWIQACLKTGDLLPEEGFEIQGDVVNGRKHSGPERARSWKDKPLLHNYEICAVGPYTGLNKDQLVSLLELCGSTTVQHPTLFPFDVGHQFFIVVQQNCSQTQQDYDALYKKYRVPVISREWVLDSVATYTVQPVEEYLLSGDQQPVIDLDSDLDEVKF